MIKGIPYFGKNTQEITESILKSEVESEIKFDSLYLMVKNFIYKRIVVVIDNEWLTWLNDIVFNYRDKQCYIPYYTYEWYEDISKDYRSNGKGMIVLNDGAIKFRYNYTYKKFILNENNLSLIVYDLDTKQKFRVSTNRWFNNNEFSIDKLYNLYLDSCYENKDTLLNSEHVSYIFILNQYKYFKNKELELRKQFMLNSLSKDSKIDHDYRDVRQYRYDEVLSKIGMRSTSDEYKIRRLKFESYLFCILRQECVPCETGYIDKWQEIKDKKQLLKIGESIKLIIKPYWFNNITSENKNTWSRV